MVNHINRYVKSAKDFLVDNKMNPEQVDIDRSCSMFLDEMGNGLSGKNTVFKGDLLIFNSIHPNRKPIAIIEYLSRKQHRNSVRFDQKEIYDDYKNTTHHRIKYILVYQKLDDEYGFVHLTKSNFKLILFKNFPKNQKRTSLSITKLSKYELSILPFLRSISKLKGLEMRESITEYQIQAYHREKPSQLQTTTES